MLGLAPSPVCAVQRATTAMVQHVGTGVVHREVLSGGEGSVLGRYPVGGWAEVPRPLSSKASGPVVAWCVGGGGSHVACGFGDGTVEVWDWTTLLALCGSLAPLPAARKADRRDSGGAGGARASDDDDDDASDDEGAESDLTVARVAWGARARTLAVCYAAKSDDASSVVVAAWDVEDGCAGARAPRVAKRFDDFDDAADLACAESLDAFAFVLATPDGTGAVFVADGCSGAAPAFERLDDDGEDDDASWALAFAGEALLAVSPAFRCTVFRRDRGAWAAAAQLDWSAAAAGAPRGFRPEPRLAAAGGVVALAGATSVDVFRAADFAAVDLAADLAPTASLGAACLARVRGDAVGAAALVWDRVHVGAAADGGGAVALATLAEPPYAGPRAREPYAGESRVFAWSLSDGAVPSDVEPEVLPSALPRFQAPKPSSKKTGAGAVAGAPPPRLEAVATRVHGPPRSRRLEALCLDSSGALREAGAAFATVWAGAHFPVGYELLLDNVHYAECEDELDFCGGVEQLPTYETDLRTVDGFFAVSMDDEELSDEVLDVVGSSRAEPPPRPYASPLTASGRVARGHDDELAGASVGAVGDPTVAKFRALLL